MNNLYSKEYTKFEVLWDINDIKDDDTWKISELLNYEGIEKAKQQGYSERHMELWHTSPFDISTNRYSFLKPILTQFPNNQHLVVKFQMQPPGAALKLHIDPDRWIYNYWSKKGEYMQFIKMQESRLRKAIIFLEDHKPGHFNVILDNMNYTWNAGDAVYWNPFVLHAGGNFGVDNKYYMVVDYYV